MMQQLKWTLIFIVLGGLTVNVSVFAASLETSPGTRTEPAASAEPSPAASDNSPAAAVSGNETASQEPTDGDAAAGPDGSVASSETTDVGPSVESDNAVQADGAVEAKPDAGAGGTNESDPAPPSNPAEKTDAAESDSPNSVSVSFLVSSIYNFRGLNVFKETSQSDQNALFSPSVTGTVFHPGLWLKYAGFFQINGDNRGYLVDSGLGAEQNLAVGFDYDFSDKLRLSTSLTYLFYPFALSRITGVEWPSYLEPAVGIDYTTDRGVRLGVRLSYYAPIQERLREQRYMYTLATVGKAVQLHPRLAIDFAFSIGYKLFADPTILQDTIFDADFCVSLPVTIVERLKVVPGVHAAWGYFVDTRFGDQYMIFAGLDLVADF